MLLALPRQDSKASAKAAQDANELLNAKLDWQL